ncbi:MAG TPA: hypothetical protein VFP65_02145 [Anaeromyxobacteraceae bacterium]|nr:hypothetical protein [Anaeromyxobacteraceae bacterium]
MSPPIARALLALALAAAFDVARACSVCSRGDPLAPAADAHGSGGDLRLALDFEVLSQRSGSPGAPTMHDDLDQVALKLTTVYSPVPPLNLVLSVPFVHKKMTMEHAPGDIFVASDLTGLGDVEVGVRWFFWESVNMRARMRQSVGVSLGSSFPTGANDAGAFEIGQPNPEHGQPGTGAFGPYAGLSYRLARDPFAALVSVSGRTHDANAQGYRYGSALLWTVQGQWTALPWLAAGFGLDGHHGRQDLQAGALVPNTGGTVIWASPSLFVNLYGKLWATLRGQIPVATAFVGDQSVSPVVTAGLQFTVF